jgi:hypothetical protein
LAELAIAAGKTHDQHVGLVTNRICARQLPSRVRTMVAMARAVHSIHARSFTVQSIEMQHKTLKNLDKIISVAPMMDWANNVYKTNGYWDVRANSVQLEIQKYPKLSSRVHF